jgi:uncharacterized protein
MQGICHPAGHADTLPPFSAKGGLPLLRQLLLGLYLFHCGKLRARTSNMSDDLIRYDILTQDALRRVIRKVLEEVQRTGLPGEHHFFITFSTAYPGVRLSTRMLERYPDEMTIVIQHSFWNLEVTETAFEIDLSFDDIRERLRIPFDAVRGFFDPSVKFGLQFDVAPVNARTEPEPAPAAAPPALASRSDLPKKAPAASTRQKPAAEKQKTEAEAKTAESGAEVVSLDSFRKKK